METHPSCSIYIYIYDSDFMAYKDRGSLSAHRMWDVVVHML